MIARVLSRVLPYVIIAALVFNMTQRRHLAVGERKRFASLELGALLVAFYCCCLLIGRLGLSDTFLIPVVVLLGLAGFARRARLFPHRLRCSRCDTPLPLGRILYYDAPLCASCDIAGGRGEQDRGGAPPEDTEGSA